MRWKNTYSVNLECVGFAGNSFYFGCHSKRAIKFYNDCLIKYPDFKVELVRVSKVCNKDSL